MFLCEELQLSLQCSDGHLARFNQAPRMHRLRLLQDPGPFDSHESTFYALCFCARLSLHINHATCLSI